MINLNFNVNKVVQIVNFLLQKSNGSINYTKLLKLLYIADKEFLNKWDLTISTDHYTSMANGPVLSETYNLIKGEGFRDNQIFWDCLFVKNGYDLVSINKENNIPTTLLSKAEKHALEEVYEKFKDYNYSQLIEYTHDPELFPEVKWEEAEESNTSIALPIEDILTSLNRTEEEISQLSKEIKTQQEEIDLLTA